jgi:signal transduction histidine kinase
VLVNLASNALKFTYKGYIKITATKEAQDFFESEEQHEMITTGMHLLQPSQVKL